MCTEICNFADNLNKFPIKMLLESLASPDKQKSLSFKKYLQVSARLNILSINLKSTQNNSSETVFKKIA